MLAATIVTFLIFQRKAKPEKEIFTEKTLKAGSINETTLIEKLLENIKEIHIDEQKEDIPEFKITFRYEDSSTEVFRYNGNINNFLAMLEHYQQNKF